MKYLLALLLILAPVVVDAALVDRLPVCSLGNGYDANKDGVIDSGCPGSDHMTAITGGFAAQAEDCNLGGTAVSFADAAADDGNAVRIPPEKGFLSGQIRCLVTLDPGTYTVHVRVRVPNSGFGGAYMAETPFTNTVPPSAAQRSTLVASQQLTYTWRSINQQITVVGSPTQVAIYFMPDPSMEVDCVAVGAQDCPDENVLPPSADYVMLRTTGTPTSCSDLVTANNLPFTGFSNSNNTVVDARFLWKDAATDLIYGCIKINDAVHVAPTTGADNTALFNGTDDGFELLYKDNTNTSFETNTIKIVANINATPSVLDRNYPSGTADNAYSGSCSFTRTIVASTSWQLFFTCNRGFNIAQDSVGKIGLMIMDNDGAGSTYKLSRNPILDPNDLSQLATVLYSSTTAPAAPADSTAPSVSGPSVVSVGTNSLVVSFTCTDAETGCPSARMEYDTNSGSPYALSVSSPTGCTLAADTYTCFLGSLTAGTSYFFRGCGINGAGLETCGSETNAATSSSQTFFVSTSGNNSCTAVTCRTICNSAGTPCAKDRLQVTGLLQPGDTWTLANGTYTGGLALNGQGGILSGTSLQPITIKATNERQALFTGTGNDVITIQNLSWYRLDGLQVSNTDSASSIGSYGNVLLFRNTNFVVRRMLIHRANRAIDPASLTGLLNRHLLAIVGSDNFVIEENELWNSHRHYIYVTNRSEDGGTGGHAIRRNYCNVGASSAVVNGNCVVMYPSSNNIVENNFSDSVDGWDTEGEYGTNPANNLFLANIVYGALGGRDSCRATRPTSTWRNNVSIGTSTSHVGIYLRGASGAIVDNNTHSGTAAGAYIYDTQSVCVAGGSASMTGRNNLALGASVGFSMSISGWTQANPIANNNTTNYSPTSGDSRYTSPATTAPGTSQLNCPVFTITGSPYATAGVGGASVGATVLYAYANGVLTTTKIWNSATNQLNSAIIGVEVSGVNNGSVRLATFGSRVLPSCASWPAGY